MRPALPPYAYVPGRDRRHDPATFDAVHASVPEGAAFHDLTETLAWAAGLWWLERRYFWEAHEALEPVWMQCRPGTPERDLVQGLIQLANAGLKARMQRPRAVQRLCAMARGHFGAAGALAAAVIDPEMIQGILADLERGMILDPAFSDVQ
ncbi:MAG: DUF309 domain-containing protein [Rhodobacteraceae bacterium]|nr:DUF309 domain-containing protein [Paracoccaceae bacterium]